MRYSRRKNTNDRVRNKRATLLRVLGMVASLSIVVALLRSALTRTTFVDAVHTLGRVSPVYLSAFPLFLAWNLFAVFGWRSVLCALKPLQGGVTWMLFCRISAQSVNTFVPTGGLGGELFRSLALSRIGVSLPIAGTATLIDNVAGVIGGLLFSVVTVFLEVRTLPLVRTTTIWAILGVAVVMAFALYYLPKGLVLVVSRYRGAGTHQVRSTLLSAIQTRAFSVAVLRGIGWRVAERLLTAGEIWIGFRALNTHVRLLDACLVVAALVLASFVFFLIPAQLGAAEGAIVTSAVAFGITPSLALSVAVLRRSRQLLTSLVGLLLVPWISQAIGMPCRGSRIAKFLLGLSNGRRVPEKTSR